MEQVLSSSEVSSGDEDNGTTKLSLSVAVVQKEMIKLARQVKKAERKYQDAEKRAAKWEKLYRQLKSSQTVTVKEEQEEAEIDINESEVEERKPAAATRRRSKRKSSEAKEKANSNKRSRGKSKHIKQESRQSTSDNGESAERFNALDEKTQDWIKALGLKDGYGTQHQGLDQIGKDTYVAPPSFERVFLLTDFLFPVEEGEETYHRRLWKSGAPREGKKVRDKLRTIKEKTPDNYLVCWHQFGRKWIPPTAKVLAGLVRFLLDVAREQEEKKSDS